MGAALGIVGTFIKAIFVGAAAGSSLAYVAAVNIARVAVLALASKAAVKKPDLSRAAVEKLFTVRDSVAPQRFCYGEDMVAGPIMYSNSSGSDREDLWVWQALLGHEIESFEGYRIDDYDLDLAADLSGSDTGTCDAGKFDTVMTIDNQLGTTTQAVPTDLDTAFTEIDSTHQARGWATVLFKNSLIEGFDDAYENGPPQNYRAIVRGKKIYDPRLDTTNGGSGPHRLADDTTWEWSYNPALILADFLRWDKFGYGEADARIDWPKVITAADICEETVAIPTASTQERYTCNITFDSTMPRRQVRDDIVNSMLGRLVDSQGQWRMWAGAAITPDVTLTEDNLAGTIQLQATSPAKERFNRVRGKFVDPTRNYTVDPYPEVQSSTFLSEDNDIEHYMQADFPTANTSYEAQRNAIVSLKLSRNQRVIVLEGNLSCFRLQPGTTCLLDIAEYGFSGEKFFVTEWELTPDFQVNLTMVEEVDASWDAPVEGEYSTRSATGVITFGNVGVPAPTSGSVTAVAGGVLVEWTNPNASMFSVIEVWVSDDNDRNNAQLVATVTGNEYLDQVSDGRTRFYWLRARNAAGLVSDYLPNLTTTTLTSAAILDVGVTSVPSFAPGLTGGSADFLYTLNEDHLGAADDGDLHIEGTVFNHPDGTLITPDVVDWALSTFYEGAEVGRFYVMFSATVAETRFGGVAADWGTGDDTRFICVTWDSINLWRARNDAGTYFTVTPVSTDCIIAICDKTTTGGGIESVVPVTGGTAGADGSAGGDGQSVHVANVYQRASSAPATPTVDDGSYNFTTNVLTPPSGWSVEPPAGSDPLYVSTGSFSIVGIAGTDSTVTWTAPDILVQDGADGATGTPGTDGDDGLSVFVGNVYQRSASAPSTPTVNDGQYNFTTGVLTPPSGWSTTVPGGTDPLYVTTGAFEIIGPTGIDTTVTWVTPTILAQDGAPGAGGDDGLSVFVAQVFQRSASAPATPTADDGSYNFTTNTLTPPAGWSTEPPAGSNPLYVSTGSFEIVGQSGTDNTVTWTAPDLLVQDGADGGDGGDGDSVYVASVFQRSATAPATPTVDDGQYNFTTNVLTPPSGWSTSPPAGSDPLYVSVGSFSISGATGIDTTVTWTSPDLLVQDGQDGAAGAGGDDGLSVYVANVYQRSASAPGTPTADDGSYNFTTNTLTPPAGWSVAVPAGSDPLYVSSGSFEIVGQSGTDNTVTWTSPDILAQDGADGGAGGDGDSVYVANVFIRSASAPSTPTADDGQYNFTTNVLTPPSGWSVSPPAGSDPLYISTGSFSINGATGIDTTVTWTAPDLLVQDGQDGGDGQSVYVANVYLRASSPPATPTADSGQYNFTTNVLTPPTAPVTWFVEPPAGTDPLYVSIGSFSIVGDTGIDTTVTWTAPNELVSDGTDGDSVYVANVYQRALNAPATPTADDGEYNFTTNVLTPPAGWSVAQPPGDEPLYVSTGSFSISGATGTDTTVVWTSPDLLVTDGEGGSNALNDGRRFLDIRRWWEDTAQSIILPTSIWSIVNIASAPVWATSLRGVENSGTSRDIFSNRMPCDVNKKYRVAINAQQPSGDRNNYLCVVFYDSAGDVIAGSGSGATGWTALGSYHYWSIVDADFPSTWTEYNLVFGPGGSATIPAGAEAMAIGALCLRDGTNNTTVELHDYHIVELTAAISTQLTNANHSLTSGPFGLDYDLTGSGGTHNVFDSGVDVTTDATHAVEGTATKNGLTMSVVAGTGVYSLSGASWDSDSETFTLRATYLGNTFDQVYTITKAKQGADNLIMHSRDWELGGVMPQGRWSHRSGPTTNHDLVNDVAGPFNEYPFILEMRGDGSSNPGWYTQMRWDWVYDEEKSYIFYVWARRVGAGTTTALYLGYKDSGTAHVTNANTDVDDTNPYFLTNMGSVMVIDKWYLCVGVIYPDGYTGGDQGVAGLYDPTTGLNIQNQAEFYWNGLQDSGDTWFRFGMYDTSAPPQGTGDGFDIARPLGFIRDGSEPTVEEMLAISQKLTVVTGLTQPSTTVTADADGTNYSLTGTGGTHEVWRGANDVTADAVHSVQGGATKNGLTMAVGAATGIYSLSGGSWTSDNESFTLRAVFDGITYDKIYNIGKLKDSGVTPTRITPIGKNVVDIAIDPDDAEVEYQIDSDGDVYNAIGLGASLVSIGTWLVTGAAADYHVRLFDEGTGFGDTPTGASIDTWLVITTDRNWRLFEDASAGNGSDFFSRAEWRDATTLEILGAAAVRLLVDVDV